MNHKNSKLLGGILLVSGTAIGAGMLALPISTAQNGFFPSLFAFLFCWAFMTIAALLLLEINLKIKGEKDIISMADATIGVVGKTIAWVSYLLLLYSLISAYLKGGSAWLVKLLADHQINLGVEWAIVFLIIIYSIIVSYGTAITEKINRVLMIGLIIAYFILMFCALPSVEVDKVTTGNLNHLSSTFPLILTAFGFSVVLPSLTNYLERNVKALRKVVILGSLLPLFIYLLWELIALGIIPLAATTANSVSLELLSARHDDGTGVAIALEHIVGNPWITISSQWFAIFAILTSLLGVSLALFHFLADGLKIRHHQSIHKRLLLSVLTYLPPFLVLLLYPTSFARILSFAGIFVAVLMGILPIIMVWCSRNKSLAEVLGAEKQKLQVSHYQVFGGRWTLILSLCFFVYIIYLEMINCLVCQQY